MNKKIKYIVIACLLFAISFPAVSQKWREEMDSLTYSPKYFGPNAFPIPEVFSGKINSEYQIETRYDYHHADGDNTQDIYLRGYMPFGKKAALELSGIIREFYHTSEEVMKERNAVNSKPANGAPCYGDLVVNAMFQLLESEKWFDAMIISGLKTSSGNMLVDARYTDAASYWFNLNLGKNLFESEKKDKYLRIAGMVGFYCYMTNLKSHRQNDAFLAGGGFKARYRNIYLDADLRGFQGYLHNGDQPLLVQSKLKYSYRKHSVYARYQYGIHDYIYQTFSGGYIFSF